MITRSAIRISPEKNLLKQPRVRSNGFDSFGIGRLLAICNLKHSTFDQFSSLIPNFPHFDSTRSPWSLHSHVEILVNKAIYEARSVARFHDREVDRSGSAGWRDCSLRRVTINLLMPARTKKEASWPRERERERANHSFQSESHRLYSLCYNAPIIRTGNSLAQVIISHSDNPRERDTA